MASSVAAQLPTLPNVAPQAASPANPPQTPPTPPAGNDPAPPAPDQLSIENLTSLQAKVQASAELSDEKKERERALALIAKAMDDLRIVADFSRQEAAFADKLKTVGERKEAAERVQRQQRRIEQPWSGEQLEKLEQTLAQKQQLLAQKQAELTDIDNRIAGREERKKLLRQTVTDAPKRLTDLDAKLQALTTSAEPVLLQEATKMSLLAEKRRVEKEPTAAQSELALYTAEEAVNLLGLERAAPAADVDGLKKEIDLWERAVAARRRVDAEGRLDRAKAAAESVPPALQKVYLNTAGYAEKEIEIRRQLATHQSTLKRDKEQYDKLSSELTGFQDRKNRSAESVVIGLRLRKQRRQLPNIAALQYELRERVETYEVSNTEYMDLQEDVARAESLDAVIARLKHESTSQLDDEEDQYRVEQMARSAVADQHEAIDATLKAYSEYLRTLEELDAVDRDLIAKSQEFEEYINERVLWIRSHRPLSWTGLTSDVASLQLLFSATYWTVLWQAFVNDVIRAPWWYAQFAIVLLVLAVTHRHQRQALKTLGSKAQSRLNTELRPTWRALLWTLLLSLAVPLMPLFFGWRMSVAAAAVQSPEILVANEESWMQEFSQCLLMLGIILLGLEFARNVCRSQGLGEAHFGWPKRVVSLVTNEVRRFEFVVTPIILLLSLFYSQNPDSNEESLQQIFAISALLMLTIVMHRLTRPATGVYREWIDRTPHSWIGHSSVVFYLFCTGMPLALIALSAMGYHYASGRLAMRLGQSLLLVFGMLFVRALVVRVLTMRQRRLAIDQARERRAAASEQRDASSTSQAPSTDLSMMSIQTRRLIDTTIFLVSLWGIWLVWDDVLPALRSFAHWTIPGLPITYAAAGMAVLIGVLTGTAARNLPALLEMLLLERLPIDRSDRYAILAVVRYVLVVLGIVSISQTLSIQWENVQWLAAALTFGLGFGLQEIFANFVSGLIILFEQPVRVGDVVTIDGVSGVVSQIRIRSTTITDWDRKEYIVPNREFITGKLLNWTLNDTINRLVIPVGVAYGSDPNRVREILSNVIAAQAHVMRDPPPVVTFEGFGDSSLDFKIRVFLPSIEKRLEVNHSLHLEIYQALNAAGIEIPFPQRDIHIRSVPQSLSETLTGQSMAEEQAPTPAATASS